MAREMGSGTGRETSASPQPPAFGVVGNVQVGRLRETALAASADPSRAVLEVQMEGTWSLQEGQPQFSAVVPVPAVGSVELAADFPPPLGGWGRSPSPVQYCLYGATACFLSTFAVVAALEGVHLNSLRVRCSARLNLQRFLGVGDAPVVESLKWTVLAEADVGDEELERLRVLAEERCPATWCLQNRVPVTSEVRRPSPSG